MAFTDKKRINVRSQEIYPHLMPQPDYFGARITCARVSSFQASTCCRTKDCTEQVAVNQYKNQAVHVSLN